MEIAVEIGHLGAVRLHVYKWNLLKWPGLGVEGVAPQVREVILVPWPQCRLRG